jgi:hypothetical protein
MLSTNDLVAIAVLAGSIGVADIVRIAQQLPPPEILPAQLWTSVPRQPDPEIEAGCRWLDQKAMNREREFQQQQRQQADEQRELRLERRLESEQRLRREGSQRP